MPDVRRLQGAGHLLEHHRALRCLLVAVGARVRIENHLIVVHPTFRRRNALGRVGTEISLRAGGGKVVDREEARVLVPDWAPASILLAKVDHRALPVLALRDVLAAGQLVQAVRLRTHHFFCPAVDLLDPLMIGGSPGEIVAGLQTIVRALIKRLFRLVGGYDLGLDATFLG